MKRPWNYLLEVDSKARMKLKHFQANIGSREALLDLLSDLRRSGEALYVEKAGEASNGLVFLTEDGRIIYSQGHEVNDHRVTPDIGRTAGLAIKLINTRYPTNLSIVKLPVGYSNYNSRMGMLP